MAAARGANHTPQIARVHGHQWKIAAFAEESAGTLDIFIAAGDAMALPRQQSCEESTGRSGAQDENAHERDTLPQGS